MNSETKICENCKSEHFGHYDICYTCFDCETEEEYASRNNGNFEEKVLTRIEMVVERFKKTPYLGCDPVQAWYDIKILLDEIHDRDVLIQDFREQIYELKKNL